QEGRNGEDRAATPLHQWPRRWGAGVEHRREVGLDHVAPVLVRHTRDQAVTRDACVVDEDVDLARLLDERARGFRIRDIGLHCPAADLGGDLLRFLPSASVSEDDRGAATAELERDRPTDSSGASGDERDLAGERAALRRHQPASDLSTSSRLARSFTEIARTERSIRLIKPESTLPGPTSTNVVTPSRINSRAAWVNLTGAVSWSTSSAASRCAGSI